MHRNYDTHAGHAAADGDQFDFLYMPTFLHPCPVSSSVFLFKLHPNFSRSSRVQLLRRFNFLEEMKETVENPLHLTSLNHISLVCNSVEESINFYQNVLGFVPIRRPDSFNFDGAWWVFHETELVWETRKRMESENN